MDKLMIDTGVKEYDCGGSEPLRANFSDPNMYATVMEMTDKIVEIENEVNEKAKGVTDSNGVLQMLKEADEKMKALLNETFGNGNDFDKILGGVSLMAVASNGERVVTNFVAAITPLVQCGISAFADDAVAQAKAKRSARK